VDKALLHLDHCDLEAKVVSYEGELMEIEHSRIDAFRVGDFLSCDYSGLQLEARVLKVGGDRIYLFTSSQPRPSSSERRSLPRQSVEIPAHLMNIDDTFPIQIVDIHLWGVGFVSPDANIDTGRNYYLTVDSHSLNFTAQIKVSSRVETLGGYRYGAEIAFMKKDDLKQLRVFLMFRQFIANM
jgi:hypothetical protein